LLNKNIIGENENDIMYFDKLLLNFNCNRKSQICYGKAVVGKSYPLFNAKEF